MVVSIRRLVRPSTNRRCSSDGGHDPAGSNVELHVLATRAASQVHRPIVVAEAVPEAEPLVPVSTPRPCPQR